MGRVRLSKGREYYIRLYLKDEIVEGVYLGRSKKESFDYHVFKSGDDEFLLVDNHWLDVDNGIITHDRFSSPFAVKYIKLSSVLEECKNLASKILEEVGVKISWERQ